MMIQTCEEIQQKIINLKKQKRAVVLAHNYQIPEIQDVADFVGDSLGLAQAAKETDADIILFCGVHFMAETAAILCPEKRVLLPDLEAGCSLAETINAEQLRTWKSEHPEAIVVSYVNTTAKVKALSDYCCTSTNAEKVVRAIPKEKEILFLPDMFLGHYIKNITGRRMHIWPGECHVHAGIRPQDVQAKLAQHQDAEFLIHPECGCVTQCMLYLSEGSLKQGRVLSTGGMINYTKNSATQEFVVGTETGILYPLKKANPDKAFYPLKEDAVCEFMKKINPEKVLTSLEKEAYLIHIEESIARLARRAIERMLEIT